MGLMCGHAAVRRKKKVIPASGLHEYTVGQELRYVDFISVDFISGCRLALRFQWRRTKIGRTAAQPMERPVAIFLSKCH